MRWAAWIIFGKPFDPQVLKAKVRLHAEMYRQSKLLRQMEKKLEEAERWNKQLLDNILDILCVTSPDGTLVYLNGAFEDLSGYKKEEWVGKNLASLVRPKDLTEVMKCITETVRERKRRVMETAILEGSGRPLPIELYTRPSCPGRGNQGGHLRGPPRFRPRGQAFQGLAASNRRPKIQINIP